MLETILQEQENGMRISKVDHKLKPPTDTNKKDKLSMPIESMNSETTEMKVEVDESQDNKLKNKIAFVTNDFSNLNNSLLKAISFIPKTFSRPVEGCVKFSLEDNYLFATVLCSSSYLLKIKVPVQPRADSDNTGTKEVYVLATELSKILKAVPKGATRVEICMNEDFSVELPDYGSHRIPVYIENTFPDIGLFRQDLDWGDSPIIEMDDSFCSMLGQTSRFSAVKGNTRYNKCRLWSSNKTIHIASIGLNATYLEIKQNYNFNNNDLFDLYIDSDLAVKIASLDCSDGVQVYYSPENQALKVKGSYSELLFLKGDPDLQAHFASYKTILDFDTVCKLEVDGLQLRDSCTWQSFGLENFEDLILKVSEEGYLTISSDKNSNPANIDIDSIQSNWKPVRVKADDFKSMLAHVSCTDNKITLTQYKETSSSLEELDDDDLYDDENVIEDNDDFYSTDIVWLSVEPSLAPINGAPLGLISESPDLSNI